MRPDEHKQSRSRRHLSKIRDTPEATEIQEKRKERRSKANKSRKKDQNENEGDEDLGKQKSQSSRRQKLESNAYRYEEDSPVEDTEVQSGADSEIDDFRQMIDRSEESMSFDPSTYFQFKEEKEWNENIGETDEMYKNLMNIRFDALDLSLCSVSLHERLDLTDDIFVKESDDNLDSMLDMRHPIVPKLLKSIPLLQEKVGAAGQPKDGVLASNTKSVKGEKKKESSDPRPKSQSNNIPKVPISSPSSMSKQSGKSGNVKNANIFASGVNSSKSALTTLIKDDDDIDDFLKSLENGEDEPKNTSSSKFPVLSSSKKLPAHKIQVFNKNPGKNVGDDMEDWLDDMLK